MAFIGGSAIAVAAGVGGLIYLAFVNQNSPTVPKVPQAAETARTAPGSQPSAETTSSPQQQAKLPAGAPGAITPDKSTSTRAAAAKSDKSAPAGSGPSFDIVRVEPSGEILVAGRSEPGQEVELLNKGQPVGKVKADQNGQFVIIPKSLEPGAHQLQLRTRVKEKEAVSRQAVSVSVPEKGGKDIVVALAEPDKPTVILSDALKPAAPAVRPAPGSKAGQSGSEARPGDRTAAPSERIARFEPRQPERASEPQGAAPDVRIRVVEAEQKGGFFVSGAGQPGARLRIYLNGSYVADVQVGPKGQWSLRVTRGMSPGNYNVRADVVEPASGKVTARAEVPFQYPAVVAARKDITDQKPPATPATQEGQPDTRAARPATGEAPRTPALPGQPSQAKGPADAPQVARSGQQPQSAPATAPASAPVSTAAAREPSAPAKAATVKPLQDEPVLNLPAPPPAYVVIERLTTASVQKGDSLWRISRNILGRGIRYTQIYAANTDQIRDPILIYPGQVLVVPLEKKPQPGP